MTTFASRGRPASRRVSLPRVAAAVALAIVVGAVLAGFLWLRSYAPIEFAGGAVAPDIRSPLFYRSVRAPFAGETSYILRFRPHSSFRFGFDIHNGGRLPIRIEGVATDPKSWAGPFRITGLEMQHRKQRSTFEGATSKPFTLEPGELGFVIPILQTGARCNMVSGGETILRSIRLKYSYLGVFHRTQWYSPPVAVGMVCGNPQQVVARMFGP